MYDCYAMRSHTQSNHCTMYITSKNTIVINLWWEEVIQWWSSLHYIVIISMHNDFTSFD